MIKKILFICVAAAVIILGIFTAQAEPLQYVGGYSGVKTSEVTFSGVDDGILLNKTVTASIHAVKPEGDAVKAVFILTLYENKKLVMASIDTTKIINSDGCVFSASVNVPDDTESVYELNVALFDAKKSFTPLSNPAAYPPKNEFKPLKSIMVADSEITGFEPQVYSYEYILARTENEYPQIEAYAADGGTKIDVSFSGEYPGKATISAKSSDGETIDYVIDFKYRIHPVKGAMWENDFTDDAEVFNGKMSVSDVLTQSMGTNSYSGKLFANLHGYDAETGQPGSRWVTDKPANKPNYYTIHSVADDLKGYDYFATINGNMATSGMYFEFELGADAEVIILAEKQTDNLIQEGYTEENGSVYISAYYVNAGFFDMFTPYGITPEYSDALMWTGSANREAAKVILSEKYNMPESAFTYNSYGLGGTNYTYRYSKNFESGDKVSIPAPSVTSRGYIVVVKPL